MIPLSYLVVAWLLFLVVYVIFVLLTLKQMLKHGTRTPATVIATFLFMGIAAIALFGSANVVLGTDWDQPVQILPTGMTSLIPGSSNTITDITIEP